MYKKSSCSLLRIFIKTLLVILLLGIKPNNASTAEKIEFENLASRSILTKISRDYLSYNFNNNIMSSNYPGIVWHTFLGSEGSDWGKSIAVDGESNIYVTGSSDSSWGNPINGIKKGVDQNGNPTSDVYVAKFNNNGELQWNTFLGSSGLASSSNITVDNRGNVFVTGGSQGIWGSPVNSHGGGTSNTFVAKLDSNGFLLWNTFLQSYLSSSEDIALDNRGNIYVMGESDANWGDPINGFAGCETSPPLGTGPDVYVAKLNVDGILQWNTFMGAPDCGLEARDSGGDIIVDEMGDVYVLGTSNQTWGKPEYVTQMAADVFIAKFNTNGDLIWNSFLGFKYSIEVAEEFAIGENGNIYIVGTSANIGWGSPVRAFNTDGLPPVDAFVAKINSNGILQWNTFLGTSDWDYGSNYLGLDNDGNIYIAGSSENEWGNPLNMYGSVKCGRFIAKLNSNGALQWHAFFEKKFSDLVMDSTENIYIIGTSNASWGDPLNEHAGGLDAFIGEIKLPDIKQPTITSMFPENGVVEIDVDTTIRTTFSEAMDASTINAETFTLTGSTGIVSYDSETNTATFTPDEKLEYGHEYTVTLSADITDESGNQLSEIYSWSFTTKQLLNEPKDRAKLILEAIDNYYNLFTLPANFPKSIIQAIVAQETGRHFDFNNEIVAEDWGRGVMQITTNGFVGAGSGRCESNECSQCKQQQNRDACKLYYANTREGINRNVRDGLYALDEKYRIADYCSNVQGYSDILPEEICWMSIVQRYNTGGNVPTEYLWQVGDRLQELKSNWYDLGEINDQPILGEKFQRAYAESARLESPAILRVYDSQGNVTGVTEDSIREEIPNSIYNEDTEVAIILFPSDSYQYQVVGSEKGNYGLTINSAQNGKSRTFRAIDIPISPNATHQYTIDWETLAEGKKGVTVQMDSDGDGIFEKSIKTDDQFAEDKMHTQKFLPIANNKILWLFIFIIVVVVLGAFMIKSLWCSK